MTVTTIFIGRRGQVTIPSIIRRKLGIKEGDRISLQVQGNDLVMRPVTQTLLDLRGCIPVQTGQNFDAIRQQVTADLAKKAAQNED